MQPIPSPSTPADLLRLVLQDRDIRRRQTAAEALVAQAPEEVPALLEGLTAALDHPDILTRRRAAQMLGRMGPRAAPAIPALIEALRGPRWTVREAVALALGRTGANSPLARDALLDCALHDRTPLVRIAAAQGLGQLGTEVPGAIVGLRDACRHPLPRIRCRALQALGELAAQVHDYPTLLERALADSHARVRRCAAILAGSLGSAALPLLPILLRRCGDGDPRIAATAAAALKRLRPALPPLFDRMLGMLEREGGPEDHLRAILVLPEWTDAFRRAFTEMCWRRVRWYRRLRGELEAGEASACASAWESAGAVLAEAERLADEEAGPVRSLARRKEALWLTGWVWADVQKAAGGGKAPRGICTPIPALQTVSC